eukprot:CAMPEP_0179073022 /NCGR_PEP_ID=MMETSP0796-20121207/32356_1 /TAXON_ID=73915 /ORGANISM="Pyrodinium bahamense, Strain pbaha01" /LENGTH=738 /DNA_ID=CAMNT_0020770201 /DNA_START=121 /DNA_END=2337 /DNA_ORIENTATION=-
MAGQKPTQVSQKSIVLWLLGLTVCYQIFYQAYMYHTLQQDSLEEECAAPLIGGGLAGSLSPQCAEVQLFRSWQEADAERHAMAPDAPADVDGPEPEHLVKETAPVEHFGEKASDAQALPLVPEASPHDRSLHGAITAIAEATDAATAAAALQTSSGLAAVAGAAAPTAVVAAVGAARAKEMTAEAAATGPDSPVTAWTAGVEDLQHRLQDHMDRLPAMVHRDAHERHMQMDGLMDAVAASLQNASSGSAMTPWAEGLVELQQHLDADMHARAAPPPPSLTALHGVDDHGDVAAGQDLQRGPRDVLGPGAPTPPGVRAVPRRGDRWPEAGAAAATAASKTVEEAGRPDARLAELHADREVWEEAFVAKVAKTGLLRNKTSEDAGDAGPQRSRSGLRGGAVHLHWSSVQAWHAPGWWEKSDGPDTVTREEAQGAHWSGMIPKVACITAISSGVHATAQMKYFINNFRLQNYEGPRQLVLVYHSNDTEAARLVQSYADGTSIRGVAARSEEPFPSTSGMRYGAWVTDADAIARWDFDEWHHPHRLSLQVRAMALSSRPACLLQPAGDAINGLSREASIVGEAAWMRRHWKPLASDEWEVLAGVQAHRVVELRHAEALPADGQAPHDGGNQTGAAATGEAPPAAGRVCARLQGAGLLAEAPEGLGDRIGARVGEGMGDLYRDLASKGRDVRQKLRALCVESAAEPDADRRARLDKDAERMSAILAELDKHFAALGALYGKDP